LLPTTSNASQEKYTKKKYTEMVQCTSSVQGKNSKILTSSIKKSEYGPDLIRPEHMGPERIITENDHFASAWFDFFSPELISTLSRYVHTLPAKFLTGLSLSRMFNQLLNLRHSVFWPFLDCSGKIPEFEKECIQSDSNTGQINFHYKAKHNKPHISGP
jgi:hypothetical protein